MELTMAPCGVDCSGCARYPEECGGCKRIQGKVYWSAYIGKDCCPVYACCERKAYAHCGQCCYLPCGMMRDLKDPSVSHEEHERGIRERTAILKNLVD